MDITQLKEISKALDELTSALNVEYFSEDTTVRRKKEIQEELMDLYFEKDQIANEITKHV